MSAQSIAARHMTQNRDIPSRRIVVNDASQLPADYSTTPGGTIFSTTPGGTHIIYDRAFLLQMRNSPIAKTPPKNLPQIPGVTLSAKQPSPAKLSPPQENGNVPHRQPGRKPDSQDEPQFEMDI